jgi:molybdopterin-guanine dinucleotide biosynthesis protein A
LTIKKKKILILLLAGGLSRRFGGGIKTFAKINGITIFEKIIGGLKKQGVNIIINANSNHKIFSNSKLPIIADIKKNFQGPLAGIYTSMVWVKEKKLDIEWILSVPSDTPFLPNNLLDVFVSKINKTKKILIARSNNKIHPVIGIWNINLLKNLEQELKSDNRKIMEWVYKNEYDIVDFPVKFYDPFFNINNKEDIIEAEQIEKIINQSQE